MNKKIVRRWIDVTFDFFNLLVGTAVLIPFSIALPVISAVGTILGPSFKDDYYYSFLPDSKRKTK